VSPSPADRAMRRYAAFLSASLLWKLAALVAFVVLAVKLSGGGL
jgi:hypothetical protein